MPFLPIQISLRSAILFIESLFEKFYNFVLDIVDWYTYACIEFGLIECLCIFTVCGQIYLFNYVSIHVGR